MADAHGSMQRSQASSKLQKILGTPINFGVVLVLAI
jgi:hypothetical protein